MAIDQQMQTRIKWLLRGVLSFMFLLSAVAKLYPSPHFALTTFEIKQLIPMGFGDVSAAYFSRTLIGCELALGIGLLQPHFFKRLVLPLSFLMLFVFSAQRKPSEPLLLQVWLLRKDRSTSTTWGSIRIHCCSIGSWRSFPSTASRNWIWVSPASVSRNWMISPTI